MWVFPVKKVASLSVISIALLSLKLKERVYGYTFLKASVLVTSTFTLPPVSTLSVASLNYVPFYCNYTGV
ncbi:hypothetical protein [Polaribacter sp. IC073]|uniref:hypothetical protein n=1 Tax=Polaribacter sp. IC073 TaxID=2508540 RepID=UPI0011BDFD79|nr:hypothetical protein [Polaribacter sp. IC073]TXD48712.1 hypothetical protein ES045_05680 [Polaribacter sp. IC073]